MNNLGIIISFTVGGLLLVALLTLNNRVIQNSGETVLNMSAKKRVTTINQIMQNDFVRIGYNMTKEDDPGYAALSCKADKYPIKSFTGKKITFCADIDTVASTTAKEITWEFKDSKITSTPNPDDCKLIRIGRDGSKSVFPMICGSGQFTYSMDTDGNPVSITVSLQTEASEKYGNDEDYAKSLYKRTFTPPNIKLKHLGSSYWGNG
jgi:hypothetical protein